LRAVLLTARLGFDVTMKENPESFSNRRAIRKIILHWRVDAPAVAPKPAASRRHFHPL
jgi:hypothetical protein